jgi:hypothetical protein
MTHSKDKHGKVGAAWKMIATDLAEQNLKKHIGAIHIIFDRAPARSAGPPERL